LDAILSSPINYITEPDITKALASLRASHLCCELGFNRVILKGDAFQVVQALKKDVNSWSRYGHLVEKVKRVLNCLYSLKVNHVRRNLNEATITLRKKRYLLPWKKDPLRKFSYVFRILFLLSVVLNAVLHAVLINSF
jgi:Iap family predicted aminopeptidase